MGPKKNSQKTPAKKSAQKKSASKQQVDKAKASPMMDLLSAQILSNLNALEPARPDLKRTFELADKIVKLRMKQVENEASLLEAGPRATEEEKLEKQMEALMKEAQKAGLTVPHPTSGELLLTMEFSKLMAKETHLDKYLNFNKLDATTTGAAQEGGYDGTPDGEVVELMTLD